MKTGRSDGLNPQCEALADRCTDEALISLRQNETKQADPGNCHTGYWREAQTATTKVNSTTGHQETMVSLIFNVSRIAGSTFARTGSSGWF